MQKGFLDSTLETLLFLKPNFLCKKYKHSHNQFDISQNSDL